MCPNQPAKGSKSVAIRLTQKDYDRLQQVKFEYGLANDAEAIRKLVRESDPEYLYHHKTRKRLKNGN